MGGCAMAPVLLKLPGGLIMPKRLFLILALLAAFFLAAIVAFLCLPNLLRLLLPQTGTALIYEIANVNPNDDPAVLAKNTARALDLRLNRGYGRTAKVSVISGNHIEIFVYGDDPKALEEAAAAAEFNGRLEFRIVANTHKHQQEIEIAKDDLERTVYYDSSRNWTARWVPIKGDAENFSPEKNLLRTIKIKGKDLNEVLVVNDPYSVTGDYLANARSGVEMGKPAVLFSFTQKGGQLFGRLTSENLPDPQSGEKNQLGIIISGTLYSAPRIQTTITDSGQITGNFTQQEVDQIVNCLNSGSLPVNLRKIGERKVDGK
jgi:SecD/SecF fusion protein